jgi:hypothetical protein
MVGLADLDPVDGGGQIGTRMTLKQYAKLVYRHSTIAAQKPRRSSDGARIMQETDMGGRRKEFHAKLQVAHLHIAATAYL